MYIEINIVMVLDPINIIVCGIINTCLIINIYINTNIKLVWLDTHLVFWVQLHLII